MREHSCAAYEKIFNNKPNEDRTILCSPTDSADDINTETGYHNRACWR